MRSVSKKVEWEKTERQDENLCTADCKVNTSDTLLSHCAGSEQGIACKR